MGAPWGGPGAWAPWGMGLMGGAIGGPAQGHEPQGPMGLKDPGLKDRGGPLGDPRGEPWGFYRFL